MDKGVLLVQDGGREAGPVAEIRPVPVATAHRVGETRVTEVRGATTDDAPVTHRHVEGAGRPTPPRPPDEAASPRRLAVRPVGEEVEEPGLATATKRTV